MNSSPISSEIILVELEKMNVMHYDEKKRHFRVGYPDSRKIQYSCVAKVLKHKTYTRVTRDAEEALVEASFPLR